MSLEGVTIAPRRRRRWGARARRLSWAVPRPKVAAGLLTYGLLELARALGLELPPAPVEVLATFAVMWLWPERRGVELELPAGRLRVGGAPAGGSSSAPSSPPIASSSSSYSPGEGAP